MRTVRWTCPVFLLVLFLSACGGLRSLSGPTPTPQPTRTPRPTRTPTQSELIDQAITTVQETRRVYEGKLSQLGREIATGREEMSPEVLSTKLYTYGTYRQAIARFDEIETQLDLAKVVLEAKMALGDLAGAEEVIKEALVLVEWTSIDGPLPTFAPGTVDEQALIDEIAHSVPTATPAPVPTIRPTSVPTSTRGPTVEGQLVQPYCNRSESDVLLQDLAPGYGYASAPGQRTWYVTIDDPQDEVVIFFSWCAQGISFSPGYYLSANLPLMEWALAVDDQQVDVATLCIERYRGPLGACTNCMECQSITGLIRAWEGDHHTIVMTQRMTDDVDNGLDVFPEGDYVDVFEITVKR